MAENKITLGQLINVLTESGIDLGTVYLDGKQVQQIQDNLSENQKKSLGDLASKYVNMSDDELADIGGGVNIKKILKGAGIGVGAASTVFTIGTGVLATLGAIFPNTFGVGAKVGPATIGTGTVETGGRGTAEWEKNEI